MALIHGRIVKIPSELCVILAAFSLEKCLANHGDRHSNNAKYFKCGGNRGKKLQFDLFQLRKNLRRNKTEIFAI